MTKDEQDRIEPLTLTTTEFARLTGFARRTVQQAVQEGRLKAIRLARGGNVRILRSELERILNGGRHPHKSHMEAYHRNSNARSV